MALHFSNFQDTENYLASIINYEWVLPTERPERAFKLERVREAMDLLGVPQQRFPAIHVGGTKGKGSTVLMMEAVLEANGIHTGAFMSPHVSTVCERVRISGKPVTKGQWVDGFNAIAGVLEEMTKRGRRLTYFEVTWMLALDRFLRGKPDAMLIEVGMGGRLDCTNLFQPHVAVLMPISHDHTKILGKKISQITWDKSHILKPDVQAVAAKQNRWAKPEIEDRAKKSRVSLLWFGKDYVIKESGSGEESNVAFDVMVDGVWYRDLRLQLLGSHQRHNAAVAIAALHIFLKTINSKLDPDITRNTLANITIPGRLEWGYRDPDVLLDVAHNPASFKALARTLSHLKNPHNIHAIVGFARGKDSRKCLKILAPIVNNIVIVPTGTPRSQEPIKLLNMAKEIGIQAETAASGVEALQKAMIENKSDLTLVAGSFPLVGFCRDHLLGKIE